MSKSKVQYRIIENISSHREGDEVKSTFMIIRKLIFGLWWPIWLVFCIPAKFHSIKEAQEHIKRLGKKKIEYKEVIHNVE